MQRIISLFRRYFFSPLPLRFLLLRDICRKFRLLSFKNRLAIDAFEYPGYAHGLYSATLQAKGLGINSITAIEFGVASGRGLDALRKYAIELENDTDVRITVLGFDSCEGLPSGIGYLDQQYFWTEGQFKFDPLLNYPWLRDNLIVGDVKESLDILVKRGPLSPIGFIAFDLDFYSSTLSAFNIFDRDFNFLPRVELYFDDVASNALLAANSHTGVLGSIHEFNSKSTPCRKILKKELLSDSRGLYSPWMEKVYVYHMFDHSDYNSKLQ